MRAPSDIELSICGCQRALSATGRVRTALRPGAAALSAMTMEPDNARPSARVPGPHATPHRLGRRVAEEAAQCPGEGPGSATTS